MLPQDECDLLADLVRRRGYAEVMAALKAIHQNPIIFRPRTLADFLAAERAKTEEGLT